MTEAEVPQTVSTRTAGIAVTAMFDHSILTALISTGHAQFAPAAQAALDEIIRLRNENDELLSITDGSVVVRLDEIREAGLEVVRLLRAGLKDAPPTDIRADAFSACDRLVKALDA